ncbi:MAG: glycosyltransferase family 4 protein [Clostridia bacterium]|nr:glycosyltransferase family 4 protein [Clostridia bacterium]
MSKNVLIVAQVIPQWYVDLLTDALGPDVHVDIITGSEVRGNVIPSPLHDPRSFASRLRCWWRHYRFLCGWIRRNRHRHYDLVFAISNPPINSYVGLKLKKVFQAPFVYMNWDIYPQIIDLTIRNPLVHLVCSWWKGWNNRNYKKIDRMLTIGEVMGESINADLKRPIRVDVMPIAVNTRFLMPMDKLDNPFCREHGLSNKFVVLYSGKMGYGHNIEMILSAAEQLHTYEDIVFVFIGEGQKADLVRDAVEQGAANLRLFPLQPEETFRYSMACGDVGLVSEEESFAHLFMPSKTYSMLACGMPVIGICSEHDDLKRLIVDEGVGATVSDGQASSLCRCILDLYEDREKRMAVKEKARLCAEQRFDLAVIQQQYTALFKELL